MEGRGQTSMLLSRPLMFSLMHVTLVTSSVMRSTLYQRRRAMRLPSAQSYLPCQDGHCPGGRSSCVVACTSDPSCSSVNIRVLDGQCECSAASFFQFGAHVQTDGDWENYSPLDTDGQNFKSIKPFDQTAMKAAFLGAVCEQLTKEIIEYLNDPEDGAVCIRTQYQQRRDWPVTHYFDRKSGSIASTPFVLLQSIVGLGQRLL
ncbi:hypothetical protein C0Q70_04576 [Pomacea canaliculata]|uniref:Uncharacterized protein n=1 Tax=Pomacea canaliculata TaxID=400727 RepID=A0A2T7PIS4_POMCA|nr:hypothetical protein C0Q70_04576 [Pomacea canaliculata]